MNHQKCILLIFFFFFNVQLGISQVLTINSNRDVPFSELLEGEITLRKALELANDSIDFGEIKFNIPNQSLPIKIKLFDDLPILKYPIGIDGNTQPGTLELDKKIIIDGNGFRIFELLDINSYLSLDNISIKNGLSPLINSKEGNLFVCGCNLSNPELNNNSSILIKGAGAVTVEYCILGNKEMPEKIPNYGIFLSKTIFSQVPKGINYIEYNTFQNLGTGLYLDGLYYFQIENNVFEHVINQPIKLDNNGNAGVLNPVIQRIQINKNKELIYVEGKVINPIDGIRMMGKVMLYKTNFNGSIITRKLGEVVVSTGNKEEIWKIFNSNWDLKEGEYIAAQFTQMFSPHPPFTGRLPESSEFSNPKKVCDLKVEFSSRNNCGNEIEFTVKNSSNNLKNVNWDFGDGQFTNEQGNITHVYSSPGKYKVQLTASDGECQSLFLDSVEIFDYPYISNQKINNYACGGSFNFNLNSSDSSKFYRLILKKDSIPMAIFDDERVGQRDINNLLPGNYAIQIFDYSTGCYSGDYNFVIEGGTLRIANICAVENLCIHPNPPPEFSVLVVDDNPLGNGIPYVANIFDGDEIISDHLGETDFNGIIGEPLEIPFLYTSIGGDFLFKIVSIEGQDTCFLERPFTIIPLEFSLISKNQEGNLCEERKDSVEIPISIAINGADCDLKFNYFRYFYKVFKAREDGSFPPDPFTEFTSVNRFYNLKLQEPGKYKITAIAITNNDWGSYSCPVKETIFEIKSKSKLSNAKVELSRENPKCEGDLGSARAIIHGVQGPVTYYWTKVSTGEVVGENTININYLKPGEEYEFHIEEEGYCSNLEKYTIKIGRPTEFSGGEVSFVNACLLEAGVGGDPGFPPYTFSWYRKSNSSLIRDRFLRDEVAVMNSTLDNPKPGIYYTEIVDANGCLIKTNELEVKPIAPRTYDLCMRFTNVDTLKIDTTQSTFPEEWKCDIWQDVQASMDNQIQDCYNDNIAAFKQAGASFCKDLKNIKDEVGVTYKMTQGHYTLYYYDKAGQLVRTVPPEGVDDKEARRIPKNHNFVTQYRYNSLKQLVEQKLPDHEGRSNFKYNKKGQLRYSQNAQQKLEGKFSYTNYDEIGRIVEVGEVKGDFELHNANYQLNGFKTFYSKTFYNQPVEGVIYDGSSQRYLTNRVSHTEHVDERGEKSTTHFSYDPHGNVEWMIRDLPGLGRTTMAYEYDLISGNVKKVVFNKGRPDQYFHRYQYDEDNRIIEVSTSKDGYIWDKDASYHYYKHGPLERTALGEDNIQGLDYLYTVQGWLKAINSPITDPNKDLGKDGINPLVPNSFVPDVFSMVLGYFDGDFKRTGGTSIFNSHHNNPYYPGNEQNLYNGNISSWEIDYGGTIGIGTSPVARRFKYDKINRLRSSNYLEFNRDWEGAGNYNSKYTYDANGNLTSLTRQGYGTTHEEYEMDKLTYHYLKDTNGKPTNKLGHVTDSISYIPKDPNNNSKDKYDDIRSQHPGNYEYDAIGNLIKDSAENIAIEWNSLGKISAILPEKNEDETKQKPYINFAYDATGNRIIKQVNNKPSFDDEGTWINKISSPIDVVTTYYVRDASGNVMGVYERTNEQNYTEEELENNPELINYFEAVFQQREVPIYGSERLGNYNSRLELGRVLFHKNDFEKVGLSPFKHKRKAGTTQILVSGGEELTLVLGKRKIKYYRSLALKTNFKTKEFTEVIGMGGYLQNNLALAENDHGILFMAATSGHRLGATTTHITDKTGKLMKGQGKIPKKMDDKAKSIILKKPGEGNIYYYFNRSMEGKLTYVLVDLDRKGYGTETNPLGEVIMAGILEEDFFIGRHFAGIEEDENLATLYFTVLHKNHAHERQIYALQITQNGILKAKKQASFSSMDIFGMGELKISPDKKHLFVYNLKEKFLIEWSGEIRKYSIKKDHVFLEKIYPNTGSLLEKGTLCFAENGKVLLYNTTQNNKEKINSINLKEPYPNYRITTHNFKGDLGNLNDNFFEGFMGSNSFNQAMGINFSNQNLSGAVKITPKDSIMLTGGINSYVYKTNAINKAIYYRVIGKKEYEIKDHLGNIRAVVSDVKEPIDDGAGIIATLTAEVVSATDYYPFGMQVPGRNYNSKGYRYGFNGKEIDDDGLGGGGSTYDYGFRIYNPQIAKFLSIDPLFQSYPWLSSYQFAQNDPIRNIDIDGLEGGSVIEYWATAVGSQFKAWWNSWGMLPSNSPIKPAPPVNLEVHSPVFELKKSDEVVKEVKSISNFNRYQSKVFDHEGGFVDDPDDPGGATNMGITFETFKLYAKRDLGITPSLENLKKITKEQASIIYKKNYWDKIMGDEINNASLAYAIYDFKVNAGGNAIIVLQKILNKQGSKLSIDGVMGEQTLKEINLSESSDLFEKLKKGRKKYYKSLIKNDSKLKKYGKGWNKRVDSIKYEKQ